MALEGIPLARRHRVNYLKSLCPTLIQVKAISLKADNDVTISIRNRHLYNAACSCTVR